MPKHKSFAEKKKSILNQHHNIVSMIQAGNYRTLLDLGCGNAYKAMAFALELDLDVIALDEFEGHGSSETYQGVQESIKEMGLDRRIQVFQGNAFDVKKLDKKLDVVFTQNVLHHLFPWPESTKEELVEVFFQDIFDVLNPGGMFCVTDIGRWNFWDQLARRLPGQWYKAALFSSINSVEYGSKTPAFIWMKHLRKAGFQDLQLDYHVPYPFRSLRPLLNNRFVGPFVESVYTIIAMKPAA